MSSLLITDYAVQRNGIIYEDATDLNLVLGQAITTGGGYEKWKFLVVFQD